MTHIRQGDFWYGWGILLGGAIATMTLPGAAQLVPDNTLGAEGSTVTRNSTVRGLPADLIQGGATRGANLFHSFRDFNVNPGQRVYFSNPVGIETILTRVTGNTISNIGGTLGVDGSANLFLLNPNGIIFGPNARLDVSGSFIASTGDRLLFPDGSEFSATNPQAAPLLTVSIPTGVQYGGTPVGNISNTGNLTAGQDLTLAANTLDLQGQLQAGRNLTLQAQDTVRIRDSAIAPFITASGGQTLVQGNQAVDIFALNHPNSGLFSGGDLVLRSANPVGGDAHYWSGGSFRIEQLDGDLGALFSPNDPVIRANGDVSLTAYTGASLHILAGGSVTIPGAVVITGTDTVANTIREAVLLSDGTTVQIDGSTQPTLDIRAGIDWTQLGGLPGSIVTGANPNPVFGIPADPNLATSADITVGSISNSVGNSSTIPPSATIFLTNQYQPNNALPAGSTIQVGSVLGVGSNITIDARADLIANAGIDSSINGGNGGNIRLLSDGNINTQGGVVTAGADSGGGGDITLIATNNILTDTIRSYISPNGIGNAGNIDLTSRSGAINVNGFLESAAAENGVGNGGNITVDAFGDLTIVSTIPPANQTIPLAVGSFVGRGGVGNGGNINLTSHTGSVYTSSGRVSSATDNGNGGNISYNAPAGNIFLLSAESFSNGFGNAGDVSLTSGLDTFLIGVLSNNGNVVFTGGQVASGLSGLTLANTNRVAGDIRVDARSLFLSGGASLVATTSTLGDAGDIFITLDDALSMTDSSYISGTVLPGGNGRAASINIQARSLSVSGGSQIGSALFRESRGVAGGQGLGGNIVINASDSVTLSGIGSAENGGFSSGILTLTERGASGAAGDITINTGQFRIDGGAIVAASTFNASPGGDIVINANTFEATGGGQVLANTRVDGAAGDITLTARDRITIDSIDPNFSTRINQVQTFLDNQSSLYPLFSDRLDDVIGNLGSSSGLFVSAASSPLATASTITSGTAGNITVSAPTIAMANAGFITASTEGSGRGGNIEIRTQDLTVDSGAEVLSLTRGAGTAGDIRVLPLRPDLQSTAVVRLSGVAQFPFLPDGVTFGGFSSGLIASTEQDATGQGGNIFVRTGDLQITNGAVLSARSRGSGNGQNIDIMTDSLSITQGGQVLTAAFGSGAAGSITVNATRGIRISGRDDTYNARVESVRSALSGLEDDPLTIIDPTSSVSGLQAQSTSVTGTGSGDIHITAGSLSLSDTANLSTSTYGLGDAGRIRIRAGSLSLSDTANLSTSTYGLGDAGRIRIRAGSLSLSDTASSDTANLSTSTYGRGNAGNVFIRADRQVLLNNANIFSTVEPGAIANAGRIRIRTGSLRLLNGAQIQTLVRAQDQNTGLRARGNAGSIDIRVRGNIRLDGTGPNGNSALISSELGRNAIGRGGRIVIAAQSLAMDDGGTVISSTAGEGNAGRINLNIADTITMSGLSAIRALVERGGVGEGGQVSITARSLSLEGGSQVGTAVFRAEDGEPGGRGQAGDIFVTATDSVNISGSGPGLSGGTFRSGLLASTEDGAQGQAGDIEVTTGTMHLVNGGLITASTENASAAGDIRLNVQNQLALLSGGLISVKGTGAGDPGNIDIAADSIFIVRSGAVPDEPTGGNGLQALTTSGRNANITLRVDDSIVQRFNGDISARALTDGTGGNIDITAGNFVTALRPEDSDILADANNGPGGSVSVRGAGVFGFRRSPDGDTPVSDITASSRLGIDGTTTINTQENFNVPLPVDRIDPASLIVRRCPSDSERANENFGRFTVTGRGGLPPNPTVAIDSETVITQLATLDQPEHPTSSSTSLSAPQLETATSDAPTLSPAIVEAQGWMINDSGKVVFTAQSSTVTPAAPALSPATCNAP